MYEASWSRAVGGGSGGVGRGIFGTAPSGWSAQAWSPGRTVGGPRTPTAPAPARPRAAVTGSAAGPVGLDRLLGPAIPRGVCGARAPPRPRAPVGSAAGSAGLASAATASWPGGSAAGAAGLASGATASGGVRRESARSRRPRGRRSVRRCRSVGGLGRRPWAGVASPGVGPGVGLGGSPPSASALASAVEGGPALARSRPRSASARPRHRPPPPAGVPSRPRCRRRSPRERYRRWLPRPQRTGDHRGLGTARPRSRADPGCSRKYTRPPANTTIEVQTFSRSPRMWLRACRSAGLDPEPARRCSPATYRAKTRPWPSRNRRSAQRQHAATPRSQSDSYRNVGW